MNENIQSKLLNDINSLKKIVAQLSIDTLVVNVSLHQKLFNENTSSSLSSPYQQGLYLLRIASSQPEPTNAIELTEDIDKELCKLLNEIFDSHLVRYFDINNGQGDKNLVVMAAFIDYFFMGKLFNSHQTRDWIEYWYNDYSTYIKEKFGFSLSDLLELASILEEELTKKTKRLSEIKEIIEVSRQNFLKETGADIRNFKKEKEKLRNNKELQAITEEFLELMNNMYTIDMKIPIEFFGSDKTNNILKVFSRVRGTTNEIEYPTDKCINTFQALFHTAENCKIYYPVNNSFYISIINFLEQKIYKEHPKAQKNLQNRDAKLEEKTQLLMKRLCSKNAEFYPSAYENEYSRNEHDLIIFDNGVLLIIEAKASPPREPLRDVSKAFPKIKDHFKSKSGLQHAYYQTQSLKNKILDENFLKLYDKKGRILTEIKKEDIKKIYCICVTRDNFGTLGCNLNYLLDKKSEEVYPWVIDLTSLESIVMAWDHLNLKNIDLYRFIEDRIKLHGKVMGSDELEFVGAYLKHYGGLKKLIQVQADFISLDINQSDIFDEIYLAECRGDKYKLSKRLFSLYK